MRETRRVKFTNPAGHELVGILERPTNGEKFLAVAAHCFTCTKDLKSLVKLSRELVKMGIAVFRFDFTGLGESAGDFSRSTFEANCGDLHSAIDFVESQVAPVRLLIGHSLGGATSLITAARLQRSRGSELLLRGIVTLAAPSDTAHLAEVLVRLDPNLADRAEGNVTIGGLPFTIRAELLEGLRQFPFEHELEGLSLPTLLIHSQQDKTVSISHAYRLLERLKPQASLLSLPDSDHLFTTPANEIPFLAQAIHLWAERVGCQVS